MAMFDAVIMVHPLLEWSGSYDDYSADFTMPRTF